MIIKIVATNIVASQVTCMNSVHLQCRRAVLNHIYTKIKLKCIPSFWQSSNSWLLSYLTQSLYPWLVSYPRLFSFSLYSSPASIQKYKSSAMLTKYLLPCCFYQPECCYPWSPPATSYQHKSPRTAGVVDTWDAACTTVFRQLVFFRCSWIYCSLSNSGQPKLTW